MSGYGPTLPGYQREISATHALADPILAGWQDLFTGGHPVNESMEVDLFISSTALALWVAQWVHPAQTDERQPVQIRLYPIVPLLAATAFARVRWPLTAHGDPYALQILRTGGAAVGWRFLIAPSAPYPLVAPPLGNRS